MEKYIKTIQTRHAALKNITVMENEKRLLVDAILDSTKKLLFEQLILLS